jgi:hypothetical protein
VAQCRTVSCHGQRPHWLMNPLLCCRLLLEELYFATLECEDEPRKKKKGDLFTGAEVVLKAPIESQSSKEDKLAN